MIKRMLLAVLIGGFSLAAAPLIGCGPADPPAEDDNQDDDDDDDNGDNGDDECELNTDCDDGEECVDNECVPDGNGGNGDDECEGDGDCADHEACDGGECVFDGECQEDDGCASDEVCSDYECVAIEFNCEVDDEFYGQIEEHGAEATTDPLEESAGLAAVEQAFDDAWDAEGDDYDPDDDDAHIIDVEIEGDDAEIEGAMITAAGFPEDEMVVFTDADAAVKFDRSFEEEGSVPVPDDVDPDEWPKVGTVVNFTIEEAQIYNADPTLHAVTDVEVVDEEVPVPYTELGADEADVDEDFNHNIRTVAQLQNASWNCGLNCFEAVYGENGEHETVFRTPGDSSEPGDCVTFIGPASFFPPVYSEERGFQLNGENFDWFKTDFDTVIE